MKGGRSGPGKYYYFLLPITEVFKSVLSIRQQAEVKMTERPGQT